MLGAGFSANAGYPIGDELNKKLLNIDELNIAFDTSEQLIPPLNGIKQSIGFRTPGDYKLEFLVNLIQYYNDTIKIFDYEEFYDFLQIHAKSDADVMKIAELHENPRVTKMDLISGSITILNQIVHYLVKDKYGLNNYEKADPIFDGYIGFLICVKELKLNHIINFHTLNHDVFLEKLNKTDWIGNNLSDGFEELGSPYYGKIVVDGREHMSRLLYYTGKYSSNLRIYKLHGSLDYVLFNTPRGGTYVPDNYIKIIRRVGYTELYKEVIENGKLKYVNDCFNDHPDFLTGKTYKIKRYQEPILFNKLFRLFKENLSKSDKLIIIGYGAKDEEVNRLISQNFDYKNKPVIIIDLCPSLKLKEFARNLDAKIITTNLNELKLNELD